MHFQPQINIQTTFYQNSQGKSSRIEKNEVRKRGKLLKKQEYYNFKED